MSVSSIGQQWQALHMRYIIALIHAEDFLHYSIFKCVDMFYFKLRDIQNMIKIIIKLPFNL